jgi:hypothetical protein
MIVLLKKQSHRLGFQQKSLCNKLFKLKFFISTSTKKFQVIKFQVPFFIACTGRVYRSYPLELLL